MHLEKYTKICSPMIYITRIEHFNAAHRVYNPSWTDEKNNEIFGRCANLYFHGHNFELIVTVKGNPNPETGYVIDLKVLGDIVRREITDKVDHRNLNMDVEFMSGVIPSCENFVVKIWEILAPIIAQKAPDAQLHSLKLIETPKHYVEYFG